MRISFLFSFASPNPRNTRTERTVEDGGFSFFLPICLNWGFRLLLLLDWGLYHQLPCFSGLQTWTGITSLLFQLVDCRPQGFSAFIIIYVISSLKKSSLYLCMYKCLNPLQYSCLENLMDRGDWWATVHRVTKGWARLK